MAEPVDPNTLRPADILILYYLYVNGQGTARTIATTISRNRSYVSDRISKLIDKDLIDRVGDANGPVSLSPAGLELIRSVADTHVLPEQREDIQAATPYSVTWD